MSLYCFLLGGGGLSWKVSQRFYIERRKIMNFEWGDAT